MHCTTTITTSGPTSYTCKAVDNREFSFADAFDDLRLQEPKPTAFSSSRDRSPPRRSALKISVSTIPFPVSGNSDSIPSTPSTPGRRVRWSAALEQYSPPPKSWDDDNYGWTVGSGLKDRLFQVQAKEDSLPRLRKKSGSASQWALGAPSTSYSAGFDERPSDFVTTWTPFNPFAMSNANSPSSPASNETSPSASWAAQLGNDWAANVNFGHDSQSYGNWNNGTSGSWLCSGRDYGENIVK